MMNFNKNVNEENQSKRSKDWLKQPEFTLFEENSSFDLDFPTMDDVDFEKLTAFEREFQTQEIIRSKLIANERSVTSCPNPVPKHTSENSDNPLDILTLEYGKSTSSKSHRNSNDFDHEIEEMMEFTSEELISMSNSFEREVTIELNKVLPVLCEEPNADTPPPIPLLVIGNDSYTINYLIKKIGQLATRFVGPIDDWKPANTNGVRCHNWIEANPLLLADGGVCYVGDWSRIKSANAERLFKSLENGRVAVDKSTLNYPLQTAI
uniref:Uncharacterized protein n=1 Tax=Glossina brevipalpis TaxID=37001 RepID=A0A1A9W452_9MUSC